MNHEQLVSPWLNRVLETDVFGPDGFKTIADFFSREQKMLLESAAKGNPDSQIATRLLGRLYPDVFPALTKTKPLDLVDPRLNIYHPLCGLALDVQELFQGTVFFLSPVDDPSVIILTDTNNQSGHLPIFIDGQRNIINQILAAGRILPTIHEPVEVTITGLRKQKNAIGWGESPRYPNIYETRHPFRYLPITSPSDLSLPMVNVLRRNEPRLSPFWSKLTISCPPITKTWPGRKREAISDWSYQRLLNSISSISTQRALGLAQSLTCDLPEDTLMMFLANYAQVITAEFRRLTK